ncbi:MAG TPA: DUF5668 domain-containing protein [Bryobacteraceae bacterium]|nr:DUF5668 domain-containing protein [Bryobacteraceae bacterium]
MPDDPNRRRDDERTFGERFRDQIHEDILDRHRAKMGRYQAKMERRMDRLERHRRSPFGGVLVGTILAGIGVLLLLQNLGVPLIDDIWQWWPAILIALGAVRVVTAYGWGGRVWGAVILFAGGVFLAHNLGYLHGDPWEFFWPVILIAIGLGMLARGIDRGGMFSWSPPAPFSSSSAVSADALSEWAVFGGVRRRVESQNFEGGELLAMFGGVNIDLTKAGIQKDEVRLEANALFGGIDIRVPETWQVVVRGAGIFGAYEDKTWRTTTASDEKKPRLIVGGFALFGGVVVKT